MSEAEDRVSLPLLQRRLDNLGTGERLTIPRATSNRLFGPDATGASGLANFAAGHGCTAELREEAVTFQKTARAKS